MIELIESLRRIRFGVKLIDGPIENYITQLYVFFSFSD